MKSEISHYVVCGNLFINYDDAIDWCIKNKVSYNLIVKTKDYECAN